MNILRNYKSLLLGMALAFTANSCDKTPINGDFDGWWYVSSYHTRTAPGEPYKDALPKYRVYWAVQLHLLSISNLSNGYTDETLARFVHRGDSLHLTQFYVHFRNHDEPVTADSVRTLKALSAIGIRDTKVSYRVAYLTDRNMTLVNSRDSLTLHKIK